MPEKFPTSPLNETKNKRFIYPIHELDEKTIKKLEKLREKPAFLDEINKKYIKRKENMQSFNEKYKKLKEEKDLLKKAEQDNLKKESKKITNEATIKRRKERLKFLNKKKKNEAELEKNKYLSNIACLH